MSGGPPESRTPALRSAAWRRAGVLASLLAGAGVFLAVVHRHYAIERWLLWTYVRFLVVAASFVIACVSIGHLALVRGLRQSLPIRERLFMSFALGLGIFGWGLCAFGHLHLFGRTVAWLWPLSCGLAGARPGWSFLRRLARHARSAARARGTGSDTGSRGAQARWVRGATIAAGLFGLLLVYGGIMSAGTAGYDARWYHLALAEHYAAAGGITRFPEGFFGAAWPHFASWLYTWAFLSSQSLFARIEQALHVELAIFVMTLVGLPVLVRWILRGRRAPGAWVALFLFPGVFLYDSSLSGASDHVLALWALALLLALRRAWRAFEPRACLLFAVLAAAAASTKYQSINVLVFPLLAFLATAVAAVARGRLPRRRVAVAVASSCAAAVILWAPHWLKNWLWYGDPLYPMLRGVLADRPWAPGALAGFAPADWRPTAPWPAAFARSIGVLASFSFAPHDWPMFHGDVPVFGSLFTLALAPLAFLRQTRRAWFVAAAALVGVWCWYWTFHQDRYLQALVPWMAAVVAALIIRLWDTRDRAVRGVLGLLVGAQIVWGADVPFLPTHVVLWRAPLQATLELLSTGYRADWNARTATASNLEPLAPLFPAGARVLVHESEPRLGTGTQVVTDARGAQGGIDYATWRTPDRIARHLRWMGVTHLVWPGRAVEPRREQILSNEVAFLSFVAHCGPRISDGRDGLAVTEMPRGPLLNAAPIVGLRSCASVSATAAGAPGSAMADTTVAFEDLDALASAPPRGPSGPPAPAAPDVWLLDERCARPPSSPAGYRVVGRFPPFGIAVGPAG